MSNSQTSANNLRFGLIATAVILVCASVATLSYKPIAHASRGVLYQFALSDYHRHNDTATLTVLRYVQPATVESLNLQTEALLEEGSASAALDPAEEAQHLAPRDSTSMLLLGAADALSGHSISDSKAVEGLASLKTRNTAQAQELYVLGLLRSSQRVLLAIHQPSAQRSMLLASIALGLTHGRAGAVTATPYAKDAVALDPTNQAAQTLYISVSHKTGDNTTTDQQTALLARLRIGRP